MGFYTIVRDFTFSAEFFQKRQKRSDFVELSASVFGIFPD